MTLEQAHFYFTGRVATGLDPGVPAGLCLSLISAGYAPYVGFVWEFDDGDRIAQDYSGRALSGQFGPEVPIPIPQLAGLVGVGGGAFVGGSQTCGSTEDMLQDLRTGEGSPIRWLPLTSLRERIAQEFLRQYESRE